MDTKAKEQIEAYFAGYEARKYHARQILIFPGDPVLSVYHLVSGQVRQYDISDQGDQVVVNIFQPPAFFPMSLAVNQNANRYFFETIDQAVIRRVPAKDVVKWLKAHPEIVFDLLKRIFLGADVLQRRMVHAMSSSAHIRMLYELWLDARRFGVKQSSGSLLVPVYVYELAARTGLTRETASRELAKLRHLGVRTTPHGISVRNLKSLESKLGDKL